MQDRGGANFGFHSLLIHNNNCEGPDKSDEDLFDSDDGFCSVNVEASLFDEWEDAEDLDVWDRYEDDSDCWLEENGANDSGAATTATTTAATTARTTATRTTTKGGRCNEDICHCCRDFCSREDKCDRHGSIRDYVNRLHSECR